ncbi:MAG: hypothetical protein AAFO77_07735 [Pseudomonadota bacterium]
MSEDERKPESDLMSPTYERKTLAIAAALFIGFCLLLFFLPQIMLAIGGENRWIAGSVVAAVLILPFVGLWVRGRVRAKAESSD